MNRFDYFRFIQMPAAQALWRLEQRGMLVDEARREAHRVRLLGLEDSLTSSIAAAPSVVAPINALRTRHSHAAAGLAARLGELNSARSRYDELVEDLRRRKQAGERGLPTLKSLGPRPRLVRITASDPERAEVAKLGKQLERFNPTSAAQRAWLLYDQWGLPLKEGKTGKLGSTDEKAIKALLADPTPTADQRGVLQQLVDLNSAKHTRTTYIEAELDDGKIYPRYGLQRTATGRVASGRDKDEKGGESATNAQNWPPDIRDIVVPRPGYVFVAADWSRVEWLLTLYFAGDEEGWARAIGGEDQHRRLASLIFGIAYSAVSKEQRTLAKRFTHGLNYGMGPRKLAKEAGCSFSEAKHFIALFIEAFPLVAKWRDEVIARAKRQHYLDDPYGWRRWFWTDDPPKMVAFLPQATGATMWKISLPEVEALALRHNGVLITGAHDSFVTEVPVENWQVMAVELRLLLEQPRKMLGGRCFPAEIKIGMNWREVS